jgi:hypothetical protein
MPHSRDVRTHASEIKFVVSTELAARIGHWARTHLHPDPHGSGPFGDEYQTTSIYFDTGDLDVFHRRGSFGRSKYRIRRYGTAPVAFLERKMRQPNVLAKRRTLASLTALDRLATADLDVSWEGHWFHRRIVSRRLQPVCQVTYHRVARVLGHEGETIRLTLDSNLAAQPSKRTGFAHPAGVPFMHDRVILELKFRGGLPAMFRRLVEEFRLNPEPASKYRMGLAAFSSVQQRTSPSVWLCQGDGTHASYA